MKKLFLILLAIAMVAVLAGCTPAATTTAPSAPAATTQPAAAKPIELSWTVDDPDVAGSRRDLQVELAKQVLEKTQGRVKINTFWAGVLGKLPEFTKMVGAGGVAQGGNLVGTFAQADLPMWAAPGLPFLTSGYKDAPRAILALGNEWAPMQDEAKKANVKILGVYQLHAAVVISSGEVTSLDQLKGKKMTALGYWASLMPKLGIAHVPLAGGDIPDALQKNLISGVFGNTYGSTKSMKEYETCKYSYDLPFGGNTLVLQAINIDTWNKISADDQKTIQSVFTDLDRNFFTKAMDNEVASLRDFYKSQGMKESTFSAADLNTIASFGKEVIWADWLKNAKDKGVPADDWMTRYQAKVKEITK